MKNRIRSYLLFCAGILFVVTGSLHAQIEVTLPEVIGEPGDEFQIAAEISEIVDDDSVMAYQFEIHFDEDVIVITDVDHSGTITPNSPTVNLTPENHIFVTWAGAMPLEGEGDLLYFTVELVDEGTSHLDWNEVRLFAQEGSSQVDLDVNAIDGSVGVYTQPEVPNLESPENNATAIDVDTSFVWGEVYNAYTYEIQIALDEDFLQLAFEETELEDATVQVTGLDHDTEHFWRIRSFNPVGESDWSEVWSFTTIVDVPTVPVLLTPENEDTGIPTTISLEWEESEDVELYHVQVAHDDGFTDIFIENDSVNATSYELTDLSHNTDYFWRVRAGNISGESDWSEIHVFTTIVAVPEQVTLESPVTESVIGSDTISLVWHAGHPEITHYELEIASSDDFENIIYSNDSITDTTYLFTDLQDESEYWWRVRAHNDAGAGSFSDTWMFEIAITNVDEQIAGTPDNYVLYQNYPNPFNPSTNIRFSIPERSQVRVEIYNAIGQHIETLIDDELSAGFHEVIWNADMSRVSSGTYIYRIEALSLVSTGNDFVTVKSMVLIK